jgi:hypothetical protein
LTHPFEIHTDASVVGLVASLHQWQNGDLRTIAFASKTLNSSERNNSTCEKECYAVVYALELWRPFIDGKLTTVVTDHQVLCWLFNCKKLKPIFARWVIRVQDFIFEVKYRPGKQNVVVDCLSRATPVESVQARVVQVEESCDASPCLKPSTDILNWI